MKLAVRKEPGPMPSGGFRYMLFPMAMDQGEAKAEFFELMGYIIIDVPIERGKELLTQAKDSMNHQLSIAVLADEAERSKK